MKLTYTQKELNSVLDQILNLMKTEGTNWVKGWSSKIASGFPVNAKTKKNYQGMNLLTLSLVAYKEGYTSNEWATYNQWKSINEEMSLSALNKKCGCNCDCSAFILASESCVLRAASCSR